ncbi:hypothetical protein SAMN02927900_04739 [Rhizobium mongolense subsp. loessense]|uniref:Uncharacterized protein n=1 Tax=Rhizobium mongolense subsp. loessense TaxID=158890 RepID=A0A1G4T677_9HYPH|nr:hypothetical protein [Rhizobium mongolense]SCW76944.1 hypothetical protein SAMN02927900_04739 [Rhizobium mongolense subsp. loessense]
MEFDYYEVRPCIDVNGAFISYRTLEAFEEDKARLVKLGEVKLTWTIYGILTNGEARAIGDFVDQASAMAIMNAILAPMARARDLIWEDNDKAYAVLDDVINQSSNNERI